MLDIFIWGIRRIEEVSYLSKGGEDRRTHYIHMMKHGNEQWNNYIRFRDYLRTHPQTIDAYNTLKKSLEQTYKKNRKMYTKGKETFIKEILIGL